ncbi:EamA family transporter [Enorma sp.]|uniref:DMT family transporter n=1 Tax=Enorma sp. TaxID=1920692 RepID=UPI0025BC3B59|nr:EamA family transporter [Enorma sp.]
MREEATVALEADQILNRELEDPVFGADAASRALRRRKRESSNVAGERRTASGVLATLFGGLFWGFSGTCADFLFENYAVDTLWLACMRQLVSGGIFLVVILLTQRDKLFALLRNKRDMGILAVFAASGVLLNQLGYLMTIRLTNAGTATVLQCLQLIIIMVYACLTTHRAPRKRELAGVVLALVGTYLLATGGNPSNLAIPFEGLVVGLLAAVGASCMSIIPARLLREYGASVVTGMGMLLSGIVTSAFVQPWAHMPALDGIGWAAFIVLAAVGSCLAYSLYMQGVRDIGSMRASLIGTIEPVSAAVTSALVLGTVFTVTDIAGFAAIIVMVFLTV